MPDFQQPVQIQHPILNLNPLHSLLLNPNRTINAGTNSCFMNTVSQCIRWIPGIPEVLNLYPNDTLLMNSL